MRTTKAWSVGAFAFALLMGTTTAAHAQRVIFVEESPTRLRAGIDATAGGLLLNGYGLGLAGLDGRLGVQATNLFAVYAQAHLVFGGGTCGPAGCESSFPGLFSLSGVADFTFHRLFLGFGGGLVYIGDDRHAGPEAIVRFGGYPLMHRGRFGRRGLMIGVDLHVDYVPDGSAAYLEPMFVIGYEAF